MKSIPWPKWWHSALVWAIAIPGVWIRLREYTAARSIWFDEATRINPTILSQSLWELLLAPFNFQSSITPPLFLFLTKLVVMAGGVSELSLRFVPLLASLIVYGLLFKVLRQLKSPPITYFVTFIFYSFFTGLIRYAVEYKPFSTDVCLSLVISVLYLHFFSRPLQLKHALALGVISAVGLWMSFSLMFVLPGFGLMMIRGFVLRRGWKNSLPQVFAFLGPQLLSFAFLYARMRGAMPATLSGELDTYWQGSFFPLHASFQEMLLWLLAALRKLAQVTGGISAWAWPVAGLGMVSLWRRDARVVIAFLMPLVLCLVASSLRAYPFEERFLLFYTPFLYILVGEGTGFLWRVRKVNMRPLTLAVAFYLAIIPVRQFIDFTYGRIMIYREDMKSVMKALADRKQPGDYIYVYDKAAPTFRYYSLFYDFADNEIHYDSVAKIGDGITGPLDKLAGRVWMVFSHFHCEKGICESERVVNYMIDRRGASVLGYRKRVQAEVYLVQIWEPSVKK